MGRLRLKFFYLLNELVGPADVNRECRKKSPRQVVAGFLLGRMCQSFEEDLKRSSRRFAAASFSSSSSDLRLVDFPNTASASARGSKAPSFCARCFLSSYCSRGPAPASAATAAAASSLTFS